MARIVIEFDTQTETLSEVLARLTPTVTAEYDGNVWAPEQEEQPEAGATEDAEPGERQRRRRRTKAEMEAARAAESASEPAPISDPSPSSSPTTSSASPASAAQAEAANDQPTLVQVRDALSKAVSSKGAKWAKEQVLMSFKDASGKPCEMISQIDPADYGACIDQLLAA